VEKMKYFNKNMQLNKNAKKTLKEIETAADEALKNDYLNYYRYKNDQINIFMFNVQMLKDKVKHLNINEAYISDVKSIIEDLNFIHKAESNIDYFNKELKQQRDFSRATDAAFHFIVWTTDDKIKLMDMLKEYNTITA
jgi:hypothetical protein